MHQHCFSIASPSASCKQKSSNCSTLLRPVRRSLVSALCTSTVSLSRLAQRMNDAKITLIIFSHVNVKSWLSSASVNNNTALPEIAKTSSQLLSARANCFKEKLYTLAFCERICAAVEPGEATLESHSPITFNTRRRCTRVNGIAKLAVSKCGAKCEREIAPRRTYLHECDVQGSMENFAETIIIRNDCRSLFSFLFRSRSSPPRVLPLFFRLSSEDGDGDVYTL